MRRKRLFNRESFLQKHEVSVENIGRRCRYYVQTSKRFWRIKLLEPTHVFRIKTKTVVYFWVLLFFGGNIFLFLKYNLATNINLFWLYDFVSEEWMFSNRPYKRYAWNRLLMEITQHFFYYSRNYAKRCKIEQFPLKLKNKNSINSTLGCFSAANPGASSSWTPNLSVFVLLKSCHLFTLQCRSRMFLGNWSRIGSIDSSRIRWFMRSFISKYDPQGLKGYAPDCYFMII